VGEGEGRTSRADGQGQGLRAQNEAVGLKHTPAGMVWHHVEDGKTMLLIPKDIHKAAAHTGGIAVIRARGWR